MQEEESFAAFSNGTIQMAAIRDTGKNHGMICKRGYRVRDQKGREAGDASARSEANPWQGPTTRSGGTPKGYVVTFVS